MNIWNTADDSGEVITSLEALAKHQDQPQFISAWWVLERRSSIVFPLTLLEESYLSLYGAKVKPYSQTLTSS